MKKLKVGVIDLVAKAPTRTLYARVMHANLASIMPTVVATWCEQEGHDVTFVAFTGLESILDDIPSDLDLVFICSFTQAAMLSYALSNLLRSQGAVTVLGGPHARCYPEDARKYFDYVTGFTDKSVIQQILRDCSPHRPYGEHVSARTQPLSLPGIQDRWKFVEPTLKKAPFLKIIPMIGSLGCPYTCSFCIDASVPYQPLSFDVLKSDLQFLLTQVKRPVIGWHDPNFGVRFDDYMNAIEEAVPPGRMDFVAESSLSLLSEPHLKRLKQNGFKAVLPGIESWYDLGNKSKTGSTSGIEKVKKVAAHVQMLLHYIPYVQTNFVVGMDVDEGPEPFELTKRFLELTPGAFPGYSLLSAFGRASPLNLEYQREGRLLSFPFHFLDNNKAMNVRPKNYEWLEFYDNVIDLNRFTYSWKNIARRFHANKMMIPKGLNFVRAVSSEGFGRTKYHTEIRRRLATDPAFRKFFNQETDELPPFYEEFIKRDLGPMWDWLPEGAIRHDELAYMKSEAEAEAEPAAALAAGPRR